ncbi:MAG: phytoene desaturase [Flavobacteriales bacterium]|jgi:phytoene desaturase|nr:phytoene desaturase [Flavobacteriales bacterium]MBK7941097.1 phytoene desaturase [Flavobacteriales bacterium]MBK8948823.1 phytoene desaturase [Flavobacteriales bacterium]MBK9701125.1 phytoene desaturase [Flavobacteriales bacterium]
MPSVTDRRCAVIGAGVAGLAVAIRLAHAGWAVTVFERGPMAGGKMGELRMDGHRFDRGPTVLTVPHHLDALFTLCGEDPRAHWRYQRLDPGFHYHFEDGTVVRTWADQNALAEEFAARTGAGRDRMLTFLKRSREKLDITQRVFLERSLHVPGNYLNASTLSGLLRFGRIEPLTSMARSNAALLRAPKAAAILNQFASYNGANPYQAPATLNLISYFELALGSFHAEGGMYAVARALEDLARRQGVRFHYNAPVERIAVVRGRANGVVVGGHTEGFDAVVSNADVLRTWRTLLKDQAAPRTSLAQPRSSSVIVFHWGMKRLHPTLGLHNMFMSGDARQEYDRIFRDRTMHDDPSVYVHISSKMNPQDAPAGQENWFAMVSAPHHSGQDWDALVERTRDHVHAKLSRMLGSDIASSITCEAVTDPRTIEALTDSPQGAIYGNSVNGILATLLRHPNFTRRIDNLFFCGGSVHPGASIPLCLFSARITADLVQRRFKA